MRLLKYILVFTATLLFAVACYEGIDPITPIEPGTDETAPVITIKYPVEGTQIQIAELVASINIKFEVTDDIELGTIKVSIDDAEIAGYSEFKDYRRAIKELLFENVTNGAHKLTIAATDIEGKTTTETVNFEKAPPYTPIYQGEIFYMPFDNDYVEMISFTSASIVGTPGFAGQSIVSGDGINAYAGANDSYLTFPTDGLLSNEFSAVFWMKINAVPNRAGILVVGAPDDNNPDNMNNRSKGFRFFREDAGGKQRFKLNVGFGDADSWFDGGNAADVDPNTGEWVHMAFTISNTNAIVYINGQTVASGEFAGVDWTGCDIISIMSGAPRFTEWDHKSDLSFMDELRLFNRVLSPDDIKSIIETESNMVVGYKPKYAGEVFYMPFDGNNVEYVSGEQATEVGTPGFSDDGKQGKAYSGAADSYLTFPTTNLQSDEFSAVFWHKVNANPDRAGIVVMGPVDAENAVKMNDRSKGFRFFREDAGGQQRFKLNAGFGDADSWFDGGENADIDPVANEWVHMAFTISNSECIVYFNGEIVTQGDFSGIDWTGCDILSIMSGAPRFTGWDHYSDESLMDELRLFNKALTQAEIKTIIDDEK